MNSEGILRSSWSESKLAALMNLTSRSQPDCILDGLILHGGDPHNYGKKDNLASAMSESMKHVLKIVLGRPREVLEGFNLMKLRLQAHF